MLDLIGKKRSAAKAPIKYLVNTIYGRSNKSKSIIKVSSIK